MQERRAFPGRPIPLHTCCAVWERLGIQFVASELIQVTGQTTRLGSRRLRLFWLSDEGWSKAVRDRSGGIDEVLRLIKGSGAIDPAAEVCVVANKDDGSPENPEAVRSVFPNAIVMPHNTRGQNRWRDKRQLIYLAALNAATPDIRWIEQSLGIDAPAQRIARLGQEVYQSAMRLDVIEIDSSDVIRRKGRPGRPRIGETVMTAPERKRRARERRRLRGQPRPDDNAGAPDC